MTFYCIRFGPAEWEIMIENEFKRPSFRAIRSFLTESETLTGTSFEIKYSVCSIIIAEQYDHCSRRVRQKRMNSSKNRLILPAGGFHLNAISLPRYWPQGVWGFDGSDEITRDVGQWSEGLSQDSHLSRGEDKPKLIDSPQSSRFPISLKELLKAKAPETETQWPNPKATTLKESNLLA